MSTRSQVYMICEGVYLYKHHDGYNLAETVQTALQRKERYDDPEYLTRIIFSTMIKDSIDEETGFGIGTQQHGDIEYLVTVNTEKQRVKVEHGHGDNFKTLFEDSFEKFCKANIEAITD